MTPALAQRARATAGMVAVQRSIGLRRRRRRVLPRALPPNMIERAYREHILAIVELAWAATAGLREELPSILASAAAERRDSARADAGEGDRVRRAVKRARERFATAVQPERLEALASEFARRTATHQRIQLEKQTRAALGADAFANDAALPGLVNGFVVENAQLITNIGEDLMTDIAAATSRAIGSATPAPALAKELEKRHGMARRRAKLVARDQIGKLNGQITSARHKALGVSKFIWRTVDDERVRGKPDGKYPKAEPSHDERNGKTYSYDKPPDGELPGEPILCRCYAEPVFDDIMSELDAFAALAPKAPTRRKR